jgi:hypothetical protein
MRFGPNRSLAAALGVVSLLAIGCRRAATEARPASTNAAPAPANTVPHGDHNPHHGGIVFMKGSDLHYEVVFDPTGRSHQLFFTDALREDLPASVASDVTLTIHRPGEPAEPIAMRIDEAGESWLGGGRSIGAPASTTARVAFTIRNEPYWIDVPFGR